MASEESKPWIEKQGKEEDGDKKSSGSVLANRKKNANNATPKSRLPKEAQVKKEDIDDDSEDLPLSVKKISAKIDKVRQVKKGSTRVKKEDMDDDSEDLPLTVKKISAKIDKVQKKKKEEEELKQKKKSKGLKEAELFEKKRKKKTYELPGQKREMPEERDPLRIFYETLYNQLPSSEMAAIWMMESGLLPEADAKKVFDRKQKKCQQQKLISPTKAVTIVKKRAESVTIKRKSLSSPVSLQKKKTPESGLESKQLKKRKIGNVNDSDGGSDDDFVLATKRTKKLRAD